MRDVNLLTSLEFIYYTNEELGNRIAAKLSEKTSVIFKV